MKWLSVLERLEHMLYTPICTYNRISLFELRVFACKIALFLFTCLKAISHTIQLSKTLHFRYLNRAEMEDNYE